MLQASNCRQHLSIIYLIHNDIIRHDKQDQLQPIHSIIITDPYFPSKLLKFNSSTNITLFNSIILLIPIVSYFIILHHNPCIPLFMRFVAFIVVLLYLCIMLLLCLCLCVVDYVQQDIVLVMLCVQDRGGRFTFNGST